MREMRGDLVSVNESEEHYRELLENSRAYSRRLVV